MGAEIAIRVSAGEFFDRLIIAELKCRLGRDAARLAGAVNEHRMLLAAEQTLWNDRADLRPEAQPLIEQLKTANETLWQLEDRVRDKMSELAIGADFIEAAMNVCRVNDRRSELKRAIDQMFGSSWTCTKFYKCQENGVS